MNVSYLIKNIRIAKKFAATAKDKFLFLLLLYSNNKLFRKLTGDRIFNIHFLFPGPLKRLTLNIRNNSGSDSFIFSEIFLHRYYDVQLDPLPATILDLGANVGYSVLYWNKIFPAAEIIAVEPMPGNFEILKKNIVQNNATAHLIQGAVAIEDGEVAIEISEKDYGHHVAENQADVANTFKVKSYSVDTIITQYNWSSIDLLKIDIEGYESVLLKKNCNWLLKVNYLILEIHPGYEISDLELLALDYGFNKPESHNGLWHLKRNSLRS